MIRQQPNSRVVRKKPIENAKKVKNDEVDEAEISDSDENYKAKVKEDKDFNSKKYIYEQTKNYVIVHKDKFQKINEGDHVKYVGADGKFRTGGFIWYKKTHEESGRIFWMIGQQKEVDMKNGTFRFALYWDKIRILWKRIDYETDLLRQSIDKKQEYISDISMFLRMKFGREFLDFMNERDLERQKKEAIRLNKIEAKGESKPEVKKRIENKRNSKEIDES